MKFAPGVCFHVYNQGNNRERLFTRDEDYYKFLDMYRTYVLPHCETLSWCLVPNHFNFQIYTDNRVIILKKQGGLFLDPVTNGFRKLLSAYSHLFNRQNERTGALFRPKTKSKKITDKANCIADTVPDGNILKCFNYIHNDPVSVGLVNEAEDWKWSSYRFYSGKRITSFCNKELAFRLLGIDQPA